MLSNVCRASAQLVHGSSSGLKRAAVARVCDFGAWNARCLSVVSTPAMSDSLPPRTLTLNNLRNNPGARKQKRRVGRGPGSGRGKTSTRGHKGQRARQGGSVPLGFEGGQTPLHIRVPKRGFNNKKFGKVLAPLGLEKLQHWIDTGRIDASKVITMKTLVDSGVVGKIKDGVTLVGTNPKALTTPVTIEVTRASQPAIEAVEAMGGTITTVYHSRLALRALLKPHKFAVLPKAPRPPPKVMKYYVKDEKRGYLSRHVQLRNLGITEDAAAQEASQ